MNTIMVEKRDGSMEPLRPEKYHEHLEHACKGYDTVSMSEIEMNASVHIVNGTKSSDIQKAFIRSAAEMIYENPDCEVPAGRLLNQDLRKEVYGSYTPDDLLTVIKRNTEKGLYDGAYLFEHYTEEEIVEISKAVDYTKDDKFGYGGLKKNMDSYLLKQFGVLMETPQEMYMLIQLFVFAMYKDKYGTATRKKWVIEGYNVLSNHEVSLPTPMIKQLRSAFRRFISCVLIPFGDDKRTIANASRATLLLVSGGAGLGLMPGDIRGLGGDIDNGRIEHTGILPILKAEEKTTKAFTQPDRDGSATAHYPFFHKEIERIMVLGNAKGTEDTRVRDMDHAILFNDYFFERYYNDGIITLFNMNDVIDINSYLGDYNEFKKRYEHAEATVPEERKSYIPAKVLFHTFIDERFLQSREYTDFMDNIMTQGLWKVPIKESNLCVTGDTKILTRYHGNRPIKELLDLGIKYPVCWNGLGWSRTTLAKTSDLSDLLEVTINNTIKIKATPYHKWYTGMGKVEKRTHELLVGDSIEEYELPNWDHSENGTNTTSKTIECGTMIITSIVECESEATYCGNEPQRNKLIFNGVLTGNCQEITTPNYPMYSTINLRRNIVFHSEMTKDLFYDLRRKLYHIQIDDKQHEGYLKTMRTLYEFANQDPVAAVDESLDYDYFDEFGFVNMGEIGVCIIAGINLGMTTKKRLPLVSEYLVRLEEELIDYMEYDMPEIEKAAKMRRTIGIGFSDVAHLMAKNKVYYNTSGGKQLLHDYVELSAYHMTKTSIQLAKDFGPCKLYKDTKYSDGIMPYDTYRKSVDELVVHNNQGLDWESLRSDLLVYGIRHSTLMANAPFGSSSIPSNSTPGIEFPRNLIAKKSGLPKIVPEYNEYKDYYVTTWSDEFNNIDYFKFVACMQKWMDQSISLNQYHDLTKYDDLKVPKSLLISEVLIAQYFGIKSLYYLNVKSKDKANNEEEKSDAVTPDMILNDIPEEEEDGGCSSGGCKI